MRDQILDRFDDLIGLAGETTGRSYSATLAGSGLRKVRRAVLLSMSREGFPVLVGDTELVARDPSDLSTRRSVSAQLCCLLPRPPEFAGIPAGLPCLRFSRLSTCMPGKWVTWGLPIPNHETRRDHRLDQLRYARPT